MSDRIMTHLIAGYPDDERSFACALGLAEGDAAYLEVQFPFSDPTADGPVIQHACQIALDRGFTPDRGFELVKRICAETDVPVFIMSYASVAYARGIDHFLTRTKSAGAAGVIIPDLMPGYDEGLYDRAAGMGLEAVPVVAPGTTDERLALIGGCASEYLYTATS